jgi:hypothetical protein
MKTKSVTRLGDVTEELTVRSSRQGPEGRLRTLHQRSAVVDPFRSDGPEGFCSAAGKQW